MKPEQLHSARYSRNGGPLQRYKKFRRPRRVEAFNGRLAVESERSVEVYIQLSGMVLVRGPKCMDRVHLTQFYLILPVLLPKI